MFLSSLGKLEAPATQVPEWKQLVLASGCPLKVSVSTPTGDVGPCFHLSFDHPHCSPMPIPVLTSLLPL